MHIAQSYKRTRRPAPTSSNCCTKRAPDHSKVVETLTHNWETNLVATVANKKSWKTHRPFQKTRPSSSQARSTRRKLQGRQAVSWNVDTVHALNTQNLSLFVLPKQGVQNFGQSWRRINGDFLKLLCFQYDYDVQDMRSKRLGRSQTTFSESDIRIRVQNRIRSCNPNQTHSWA